MFNKETFYTGTQVNYYVICPRKLWFFSHFLQMEENSDLVSMGRHIHETSYVKNKKEVVIDQKIAIDFHKEGGFTCPTRDKEIKENRGRTSPPAPLLPILPQE